MSDAAEQPDPEMVAGRAGSLAPTPEADKLIGVTLANRYHVEMRLGEGAMGTVYRAKHVKVGRPFAVKVLHPRLLVDAKVAQRFEREAELAGRLRHANVIGVIDVGETPDGLRYMVMDFAEGADLATLLDGPMPAARIIHLTRQLLEGLYHAHEAGLIHRDFKPENVIVETDMHGAEVPRIVDFGIAILREGGEAPDGAGRLTTNGLVLGTPHYMAPEQAVADPIDHRIDLFALGIVVYEMLCGRLPFDGTGAEVARANLLLDPPPIAQRVPYLDVDPLLEAFARRLMAKKRDHRPATAKAARELLDLIEEDRPAAAAALGVPIEASTRMPAVTQPQAPQRRHAADGNDTYPPPMSTAQQPTAPEASPVATALAANPPRIPSAERDVSTAVAAPLGYGDDAPRAASRRWIFAGLGLVLVGGIAALALRGGGKDTDRPPAPPPEESKIVMQPTPPPEQQPQPVGNDTGSAAASAEVGPAKDPDPPVVKDPDPTNKPGAKQIKKTTAKTPEVKTPKTPEVKTAEVKTPEAKTPEVRTPETKTPQSSASTIAATYSAVGQKLRDLGPAANDLWPRYRRINIQDAMIYPDKQKEAAANLAKLEQDIATIKK
jgi:serine/threonine-protein kinase